jgi:putative DNA primase/helicase
MACVIVKVGSRVQSSVLYAAFIEWTKANGESEWKQAGFSRSMTERGYRKKQSDCMWWLDIEIAHRGDDEERAQ